MRCTIKKRLDDVKIYILSNVRDTIAHGHTSIELENYIFI